MTYFEEDIISLSNYINSNDFKGSNVLITGATGLIGSICVKAFLKADDVQVVALARSKEKVKEVFGNPSDKIQFFYQDITDSLPEGLNCDFIIHTANSTTSKFFITNPVEVIDSIYTGTKNILDLALKCHAKGIVYLSSMEVFGQTSSTNRIRESQLGYLDIQNVRSCYSEGKRLAELLCKSYAVEYNLPVRVARLAQTFGAGVSKYENRVFAQFVRSALKGENIVLHTKGQTVGNYCYTADAVRAIILLLKYGDNGDVYTVVNEETTRTISELAQLVVDNFSEGKSSLAYDIPKGNEYGYATETQMHLSGEKLRCLGWEPKVPLKEMFIRMIPSLVDELY